MRPYKLYTLLCCLMIAILLMCDTLAFQTINIDGTSYAASGLLFPFSFLIACVLTEVYGYAMAGRMIWIQLICSALFILTITAFSSIDKSHGIFGENTLYFSLYHHFWKVLLASSIAIPVSYFTTDWIMSRFKLFQKTHYLFFRYIVANAVGKLILVSISYPINFSGLYTLSVIFGLIWHTWLFKMFAAIALSPLAYILSYYIKKIERIDTFDYDISYNPLLVFYAKDIGENHYDD